MCDDGLCCYVEVGPIIEDPGVVDMSSGCGAIESGGESSQRHLLPSHEHGRCHQLHLCQQVWGEHCDKVVSKSPQEGKDTTHPGR